MMINSTFALGRFFSPKPNFFWEWSRRLSSPSERLKEFINLMCALDFPEEHRLPKMEKLSHWGLWEDTSISSPYGKWGDRLKSMVDFFGDISLLSLLETDKERQQDLHLHVLDNLSVFNLNSEKFIQIILNSGLDLNQESMGSSSLTLLEASIVKKHGKWTEALIAHPNILLDQRDQLTPPPLQMAVSHNDQAWGTRVALMLLKQGVDLNDSLSPDQDGDFIILKEVIEKLNATLLQAFHDHGCQFSVLDQYGNNVIHALALVSNKYIYQDPNVFLLQKKDCLNVLMRQPLDLFSINLANKTPFEEALNIKQVGFANVLLFEHLKQNPWPFTRQKSQKLLEKLITLFDPEEKQTLQFFDFIQKNEPNWKDLVDNIPLENIPKLWQQRLDWDRLQEQTPASTSVAVARPRL